MEPEFIKQAVLSLIRYALAPLVAAISLKFGITQDVTTAFIAGGVTYGLMFLWSLANKWRNADKVAVALELPAGSSMEHLKRELKDR
jgi:hypothetical protein